jgi:hypothetical protein
MRNNKWASLVLVWRCLCNSRLSFCSCSLLSSPSLFFPRRKSRTDLLTYGLLLLPLDRKWKVVRKTFHPSLGFLQKNDFKEIFFEELETSYYNWSESSPPYSPSYASFLRTFSYKAGPMFTLHSTHPWRRAKKIGGELVVDKDNFESWVMGPFQPPTWQPLLFLTPHGSLLTLTSLKRLRITAAHPSGKYI